MRRLIHSFLALIGSLLICGAALAQDKVVYHIDNAEAQATKGLRNIRNHLDVAPETKIIRGTSTVRIGASVPHHLR